MEWQYNQIVLHSVLKLTKVERLTKYILNSTLLNITIQKKLSFTNQLKNNFCLHKLSRIDAKFMKLAKVSVRGSV